MKLLIGMFIVLVMLLILSDFVETKEDGCYRRSVRSCRKCQRHCRWHDFTMKFDKEIRYK